MVPGPPDVSIRIHGNRSGMNARDLPGLRIRIRKLALQGRSGGTFPQRVKDSEIRASLPARLGHAGNHACGGKFAEADTGKTEAAQERAAAASDGTAVDQSSRAGIAR